MGDSDTFSVTQGRLCLMDEVLVFSQSGHVKFSDILWDQANAALPVWSTARPKS